MDVNLAQLFTATRELARLDDQRAATIARRDQLIANAHANGATWDALQTATGLSRQGLRKALGRAGALPPVARKPRLVTPSPGESVSE